MRDKKIVRCNDGKYREIETIEIEDEDGKISEGFIGKRQRVGSDGFIRTVECVDLGYELVGEELRPTKTVEVSRNIGKITVEKSGEIRYELKD